MKNVLIVHTKQKNHISIFNSYATYIAKEINLLGFRCFLASWDRVDKVIAKNKLNPQNTLIHFRSSGPKKVTPKASQLEDQGYRVINSSNTLHRTGDKFVSYEWASENGIDLPVTKRVKKNEASKIISKIDIGDFVLKPTNSQGQGAYCFRSNKNDSNLENKIKKVPGDQIIVQQYIDYNSIYRVIVVGGDALDEAVFMDRPSDSDWKVSVCLNPNITLVKNPPKELLVYALKLAKVFETKIGFIDIYGTDEGYVLSEINTACSLIIHERKSGYNISRDIANYLVSQMK